MTTPARAPADGHDRGPPWRHPWVRHLRLGFNLTLAPLFLWGVWMAGGGLGEPRVWAAFVVLHVCLYGGTTAFNSYYDRDQGPIAGMRVPARVDRGLLWWSLAVQAAGLPVAWWVGLPFTVAYLVLFVVAAAYSHPAVRLKARPAAALAAVAIGQGGFGFLAGWWAAAPATGGVGGWGFLADVVTAPVLLGALTAGAMITGLYVVTQAYQTAEDARRGDRTIAVALGPPAALRLGLVASLLGSGSMTALVAAHAGAAWAAPAALGMLVVAVPWWRWARRFDAADVLGNYRRAMAIAVGAGAALSVFLVLLLVASR